MALYKGKQFTIMRDAHDGDEGFDKNGPPQVLGMQDGRRMVVHRSEVTEEQQPAQGSSGSSSGGSSGAKQHRDK